MSKDFEIIESPEINISDYEIVTALKNNTTVFEKLIETLDGINERIKKLEERVPVSESVKESERTERVEIMDFDIYEPGFCLFVGPKKFGTTKTIQNILRESKDRESVYVFCSDDDYDDYCGLVNDQKIYFGCPIMTAIHELYQMENRKNICIIIDLPLFEYDTYLDISLMAKTSGVKLIINCDKLSFEMNIDMINAIDYLFMYKSDDYDAIYSNFFDILMPRDEFNNLIKDIQPNELFILNKNNDLYFYKCQ